MKALVRCAGPLGIERLILSQGYSANLSLDRAYGPVYLSPSFLEFSLREFDRCVRDGPMVGVGELEIDNTWLKLDGNEPEESSPYDLVELANRHPEANSYALTREEIGSAGSELSEIPKIFRLE
jgi:hypothetical protein